MATQDKKTEQPAVAPIPAKVEPLTIKQDEVKPPATITPKQMSNVEMFRQWAAPMKPPTEEELAKEKKKYERDKLFAAIGDGVSAASNLVFTSLGAPNMYTGKNTASKRTKIRYDKLMKERQANNIAYYNGLTGAMAADAAQADKDRNWRRTLANDKKADERHKEGIENCNKMQQYQIGQDTLNNERRDKEFTLREKQTGVQNAMTWQQLRQSQEARVNSARGNKLGFSDGQGNQVSIYDNVWKNSKQQVFDAILSDVPLKPHEINSMSPTQREDFINQNWNKSPNARQLMLVLSKLDPANMASGVNEANEEIPTYDPNETKEIPMWKPEE